MTAEWSAAVVVTVLTGAVPVAAHHSVLGFDNTRSVTVDGRVAEVVWRYPHVYIAVDVEAPGGGARWVIESEAPVVLERIGWDRAAVRAGDRLTAAGAPSRDGSRRLRCDAVHTAGRRLPCHPPGPAARSRR